MKIGMVGLGRMGANMAKRLVRGGHACVGYDVSRESVDSFQSEGFTATSSLDEFIALLEPPRVAWCMIPAGDVTENMVQRLARMMAQGDIIIDGGNSYYKDDVRRAEQLAETGIHYLDVGTSGGVWGLERGYCLMVGGAETAVQMLDPVFNTLAPGRGDIPATPGQDAYANTALQGYLHCGPVGAGHFVKMIHNGIEYGLMQAYAEGFDILRNANSESLAENLRFDFQLERIAELWRRGSVVGSWLLDLTATALSEDPQLSAYSGFVQDSGEGRWSVQAAIEEAVPADVLTASLYTRFRSRQDHTFAEKILSAMRQQFGGHVETLTTKGQPASR